jgi:hypothetical protein
MPSFRRSLDLSQVEYRPFWGRNYGALRIFYESARRWIVRYQVFTEGISTKGMPPTRAFIMGVYPGGLGIYWGY